MASEPVQSTLVRKIRIRRRDSLREFLAELLGTYVLLALGLGSVAQYVLQPAVNTFLSINFAWGLAVAMAVWISAAVSGGHLNPAVTLALAVTGKLRWKKVPVYWAAQYIGSFFGAVTIYLVYYDALSDFDGGVRQVTGENATAGIFATYPRPYLSTFGGFNDQVVGTMFLMLCIMALSDAASSAAPSPGIAPLCAGLVVTLIGLTLGFNSGYAINPARDFAPRLFTAIAGWGSAVFTAGNYWFWIPIVAPHVGAIIGAVLYIALIGAHLPQNDDDDVEDDHQPGKNHNDDFKMATKADHSEMKKLTEPI